MMHGVPVSKFGNFQPIFAKAIAGCDGAIEYRIFGSGFTLKTGGVQC
jgi:hypothetical protein